MTTQGRSSGGLDGVRAKIGRAEELLDAVHREIAAWIKRYRQPIRMERNDQMNVDIFIWNIPDPPPDRISLLVGDAIHNLRASLDYLVWALSTTSGRTVPKGRVKELKFPVVRNPKDWPAVSGQALKYVDAGAAAIIKELQPYNGANPPLLPYGMPNTFNLADYDPLRVLHDWDIIDKHRNLHLMGVHVSGGFTSGRLPGKLDMLYPRPVEYGTEIAWVRYPWGSLPPSESEVKMHIHFPPDVSVLEEPRTWGIRQSVNSIATFVVSVVNRFNPYF